MNFSHFFIDRPIFASVISILITIAGAIAFNNLAVSQYPDIVPPTVNVSTSYAGASPEVLLETVVTPIEQEINGVENMMYMQSNSTSDGVVSINVTFELGTNPDMAQILVQNRVNKATPLLPQEVQQIGISVNKKSPDTLIMATLFSPDNSRDKVYLTNYALTQMKDELSRIYGVSEINIYGAKEYAMRVWLDPDKLANLNLTTAGVIASLQEQNKQLAAGKLNAPPMPSGEAFELVINAKGRLITEEEFEDIVIKYTPDGKVVRLKDIARIELGAYNYGDNGRLEGKDAITLAVFQLQGSNALETVRNVKAKLEEMKKKFPLGVDYIVTLSKTDYIEESISAVYHTIFEAVILVVFVIMLFLQNWRASVIPLFAIPISLIGTFGFMYLFGFSINNLSLFGLVLAVGIVVDDAIVVVENVERNMAEGLRPKEATKKAMSQVQGALVAIVLVLSSVFIPTAFVPGITGEFYKQFALTIAVSTIISGLVSLTLTPALCAIMLKSHDEKQDFITKAWFFLFGWFFNLFNKGFNWISKIYGSFVAKLTKVALIMFVVYVGLLYITADVFKTTPTGFVPKQDAGYLLAAIQLPDGASLERTNKVMQQVEKIIQNTDGIKTSLAIIGLNSASMSKSSNAGAVFAILEDYDKRTSPDLYASSIIAKLNKTFAEEIMDARAMVFGPPAVNGIGMGGDFKFYVQDTGSLGIDTVAKYTKKMFMQINALPEVALAFSTYSISSPQIYVDIDRTKAQMLNVPISNIFDTIQVNMGSLYVNDFNVLGRTYKVVAQADIDNRNSIEDIYKLKIPNAYGQNVMLGSLVDINQKIGPERLTRYNLFTSAEIQGDVTSGYSTGDAIKAIEEYAKENLPKGLDISWTDLAFQEKRVGDSSILIFGVCALLVFLLLSALYESWTMPLAVVLIVPLVLLFAMIGINIRGLDNNIMSQIGFVVLIGLACKNAILIVEFAKQRQDKGQDIVTSVKMASQNRLRPILMTSFAFIFGILPLVRATGAGSELRQALGTSVFYGMIGVTIFGLIFTPIFYYLIGKYLRKK